MTLIQIKSPYRSKTWPPRFYRVKINDRRNDRYAALVGTLH